MYVEVHSAQWKLRNLLHTVTRKQEPGHIEGLCIVQNVRISQKQLKF